MHIRVLVLQLKRLGDVIVTAPLIGSIRHQHPDAHITLVTKDAGHSLAQLIEGVDQHLHFRGGQLNATLWRSLLRSSYDLVLDVTETDRSAVLSLLSGAQTRATYQRQKKGLKKRAYNAWSPVIPRDYHIVDYHLALLKAANMEPQFVGWSVKPPPSKSEPPFVLVHPGTAREEKYWKPERWADVLNHLQERGDYEIRLTQGTDPFESQHVDEILAHTKTRVTRLQPPSLRDYAEMIARARLVVCVDTVATHLAAAYERPLVALYGPTNPFHWRARHDAARICWAGRSEVQTEFTPKAKQHSMEELETETVLAAIRSLPY